MIQKVSHMVVYVLSQERAYDFYVNKLGFDVRTDATMGDFRWLTVGPKGQPDLEITLMEVKPGLQLEPGNRGPLALAVSGRPTAASGGGSRTDPGRGS